MRRSIALLLAAAGLLATPAAADAYLVGVGDNNPKMFSDARYKVLHTRISRYIAPYDAAYVPGDLARARAWLRAARRAGVEPLIAFYHSRITPLVMPTRVQYRRAVSRFIALFPSVHLYQPWNEANRGHVTIAGGSFNSPTVYQAAGYYLTLRKACHHCTVIGLDVLDAEDVAPTIKYIRTFKRLVGQELPRIWGLHNYSDTNRFRTLGTLAVLAAVPGQVWLTETGGIVKLGSSFPPDPQRAARALEFMFRLARLSPRITRLYIFNWYGGDTASERFDAGLVDQYGRPRPGYYVVRRHLIGR
jgi:hypothetical protein